MSASFPGTRDLPASQYDLSTYWGRVKQSAQISDPSVSQLNKGGLLDRLRRTLFVSPAGLENARRLVSSYKTGEVQEMTPELWQAKKIVDSTLHPDTGQPVFLPFRMSCFVLSNLVVTAGMLTPNLSTAGILAWQITNQSLNVAINSANANKSLPLSTSQLIQSYLLAVSASCTVALGLKSLVPRLKQLSPGVKVVLTRLVPFAAVASAGALNVFLMRGEEMRRGIDIFPALPAAGNKKREEEEEERSREGEEAGQDLDNGQKKAAVESLGKSKKAATIAVSETALSRVLNSTPVMALPPLMLVRLQQQKWLKQRPRLVLPVNLGLILTTSVFALPLALGAFPQRQAVRADTLEEEFRGKAGEGGMVEFNRGM